MITKIEDSLHISFKTRQLIKLLKLLLVVLFLAHLMACMWVYIATIQPENTLTWLLSAGIARDDVW